MKKVQSLRRSKKGILNAWGLLLASGLIPEAAFAQSSYEAFAQPVQVLDMAAAEPGRVSKVLVKRGDRVQPGDLLAELDTSVLQAHRRIAEQKTRSTAKLESTKVAYNKLQQRAATISGLRRDGGGATADEVLDAETEARIAQLAVQSAEEDLVLAGLELQEIDARIEQRRLRAEVQGIVVEIHRDPGEYVTGSEPLLVTVVDLSQLRATFYLPTDQTDTLADREVVAVEFFSTGQTVHGKVEYVGPITLADSGRVRVDVLIDNEEGKLRSGLRCVMDLSGPKENLSRLEPFK